MNVVKHKSEDQLDLGLTGKFTFHDHGAFKEVLSDIAKEPVQKILFDMKDLVFIDSAALGMLLLAHDEAIKAGKKITVSGLNGQVQKMFDMTRLNRIFPEEQN